MCERFGRVVLDKLVTFLLAKVLGRIVLVKAKTVKTVVRNPWEWKSDRVDKVVPDKAQGKVELVKAKPAQKVVKAFYVTRTWFAFYDSWDKVVLVKAKSAQKVLKAALVSTFGYAARVVA